MRRPVWLRKKIDFSKCSQVKSLLRGLSLNTVCEEAKCPNIGECFGRGTAAFMILGRYCTRNCRFCGVQHKVSPSALDLKEPEHIAEAVVRLRLKYVVITSVTRDDLPDKGADQFVRCIREIRKKVPDVPIEVLIPDFGAVPDLIEKVVAASPQVINHNIETVKRLYPLLRPQADYSRSLRVLQIVKQSAPTIFTKSGIMAGLGETEAEVKKVFSDLVQVGCDFLSIGQYLAPSRFHYPVAEYVHPDKFDLYREQALDAGLKFVKSSPYTRSSYEAGSYLKVADKSF